MACDNRAEIIPDVVGDQGCWSVSTISVLVGIVFSMAVLSSSLCVYANEQELSSATSLMERGQYSDAAKLLEKVVERQGDDASVAELRVLAESLYMAKDYGKARTYFSRALPRQTTPKAKIVCESRLAMLDYRLGDIRGAEERIDNFIRKYPTDSRVGNLMVIKIRILQESSAPRPEKIKKIEEEYQKIMGNKDLYGYYNAVLVAQTLGDLYVEAGDEQKAVFLFVTAVHEMRGMIAKMKADGVKLPGDLMQGVDGMSLQIAKFYVARKDWGEARKWLENVSYVEELTAQAKYMLAQIAYQKREFGEALFMLSDDVVARIPEGETKNAMYLLLGFCWRDAKTPDLEKAKDFLKRVPEKSTSYCQAQNGLADIYRDQKDGERAEPHYLAAAKDSRFAASARYNLGVLLKERGESIKGVTEADKKQRAALLKRAGEHFQELLLKFPMTDLAKQAKPLVEALQSQGVEVKAESSDQERIAAWEKVIQEKPNTGEALQALLALAQYHSRVGLDPKTKAVIKASDWDSCAKACRPILQTNAPFAGVSLDRWREVRVQMLYLMARAELGSLAPGASGRRLRAQVQPVRIVGGGSVERAIKLLLEAQTLQANGGDADLIRDVEYALIEAMLKSDDKAVRDNGEKRYAEREAKYGNDPNYQRLAVITADWLDDHGFHEVAGRTYRAVAHKANMDREEVMHLLHLAGISYGRGGRALVESSSKDASIAFLIQPRMVLRTAAPESILKTHQGFQLTKRVLWETDGPDLPASNVLQRVSREYGVPFVWVPDDTPGSVAEFLRKKIIPRATLRTWREPLTLAKVLAEVVDLNQFDVDFDLGVSGGTPTLVPKAEESAETGDTRAIEIFPRNRERFAQLARSYGSFAEVHRGPAMLFAIIKRVEEVTGGSVIWGEGVQKDEALSREFREFPGVAAGAKITCREALDKSLEAVGLRCQVVARDHSKELVMESISCFDELRKFGADSIYAEDAMFNIAVNLYVLKDYGRMKLLLREYLKTYDNPSFAHYYDACFWLGRLFEIDRNFREAVKYYTLASEEKVVLYRPASNAVIPTLEMVQSRLSYDTLFNLSRKGSGSFKDAKLEGEFLSFIRFHTNLEIGVDPSARGIEQLINRDSFVGVPCIELLHDVMVAMGIDLRTENGDKDVAEKSYYRLAMVYKEDNLMREALENVQTLLDRFPESPRRVDALKLKLDIHKGLRDYSAVLATLAQLKESAAGKVEPFRLDYEMGRVYFDLCNYTNAVNCFLTALGGTKEPEEWLKIREALAQTYTRQPGTLKEALTIYRDILQYETSPVRQSIYAMMIHWLEYAVSEPPRKSKPLPASEAEFMGVYEGASDAQRGEMNPNDVARATWVYYALAMEDLVATNTAAALQKLEAAGASPDTFLAGEALYQSALVYYEKADFRKARECLEHLLFSTKAVEPTVKATYELARCLKVMGELDAAYRRLDELVTRYAASPYAELALKDPLYQERKAQEPAAGGVAGAAGATGVVVQAAGAGAGVKPQPAPGSAPGVTQAGGKPAAPVPTAVATPTTRKLEAGEGAALMALHESDLRESGSKRTNAVSVGPAAKPAGGAAGAGKGGAAGAGGAPANAGGTKQK